MSFLVDKLQLNLCRVNGEIQDLEVFRLLSLSERVVAMSLDNDYFSRHGGWGLPLMVFLRLRRPFVALVTNAEGNELFRVRRPFWWINSSIYAEVNGKEVGVVHRRWHLWRRIYDLYLGNKQFAVVENPGFWNWTFTLKDINGHVLAEIDRDWRGFGFELFTDAGQYVIRFGSTDPSSKHGAAEAVQDLEVFRPLSLSERPVAVALAISLDNDYFSRHGGWGLPLIAVGE
ncbi:phospholipid scramblase family protein C343.06c-like [Humulus lupulus]|uniref:phospholipid scramblase family protein C343.06c-like n=1 Tax=Humulus lupulus TaxID=3486 RepID=UPI002B40A3C4|nr:phospholipid scramblase family protein C343.06c-like [Humulus lupulus]